MRDLLHQLENNEAILVMYLADELPAEDRAEVEQMLRTDARMRAELQRLQAVDELLREDAGRAAEGGSLRLRDAALVRETGRAIRQWQAERAAADAASSAGEVVARARSRWWLYPVAAAAAVAILFLAWWGNNGDVPGLPGSPGSYVAGGSPEDPVVDPVVATRLVNLDQLTLANRTERVALLDDAESQMAALNALASSTSTSVLDTLNGGQQ